MKDDFYSSWDVSIVVMQFDLYGIIAPIALKRPPEREMFKEEATLVFVSVLSFAL
jgi:hypothetical protein